MVERPSSPSAAALILLNLAAGAVGGIAWFRDRPSVPFWYLLRAAQVSVFLQACSAACSSSPTTSPTTTSTTSTGSCPWSSPSSPRAPAPAPPSASSARPTSSRSPADDPAGRRPGDRPPRDGDHGRQLRRHLLPRPARRRHQRRLLAPSAASDPYGCQSALGVSRRAASVAGDLDQRRSRAKRVPVARWKMASAVVVGEGEDLGGLLVEERPDAGDRRARRRRRSRSRRAHFGPRSRSRRPGRKSRKPGERVDAVEVDAERPSRWARPRRSRSSARR